MNPLIQTLKQRLADLKAPDNLISEEALTMVAKGKVMLVCVKLSRPCQCDMCGGRHEGAVWLVTPSTKLNLEQLFSA